MSYELFPLQREIMIKRLRTEVDLYRVFRYKRDITNIIDREIDARIDGDMKNWVIIQINGETGSMKSSVALTIAKKKLQKSFTAKNVCHEYSVFQEKLAASKPRQTFMLDEMIFQSGIGSLRMKQSILNLVETLRKRQNNMIFVTPSEKFISDDNVTFTLEPCGFDTEKKVVRCLVKKKGYLGFYYVQLDWEGQLWQEYEKIKDEFLERTVGQNYQRVDYEKIARKVMKDMPDEYKTKAKRIKLWVEKNSPNLTTAERDLLGEQIKILSEEDLIT